MEFAEYEQVYEQWRSGGMTMAELTKTYGAEVAELIQAQYALGCEVDAAASLGRPVKDEPAMATQLNGTGVGTTAVTSPTESGSARVPFAIMQHVYRKWLEWVHLCEYSGAGVWPAVAGSLRDHPDLRLGSRETSS